MAKMLRNLIGVKPETDSGDLKRYVGPLPPFAQLPWLTLLPLQLVQTILDQGHLSPLSLSVQPIIWELDHTMRLYPMPTAVSS